MAFLWKQINWNLADRQNVSFRTSPLSWCGNLHRILGYLSSSIRRGRVSRPPEFRDSYGAGRETRPLRCFYGWSDKFQFTDLLSHSDKHIKKWLSFQSSTDCGTKAMGLFQELKMAAGDLLPALRTGRFLSDRSGSLFGSTGKVTPRPQVSRNGRFFFLTPSSHPDSRRLRWTRSARPPFPGSDPMSGWHLLQDPGRRPDRYTASAGY